MNSICRDMLMARKWIVLVFLSLLTYQTMMGQTYELVDGTGAVKTNSFWSEWFVQMDMDMTLQNPYGYDFSHVFPNGKTFGVDLDRQMVHAAGGRQRKSELGEWYPPSREQSCQLAGPL